MRKKFPRVKAENQDGFVFLIPLFIVAVVVLLAGGWYFYQQSQSKQTLKNTGIQGTPGDENTYSGGLFQDVLSENCYEVSDKNVKVSTISLSTLPLSFDKNVLVIKEDDPFSAVCQSNSGHDFVTVQYDADYTMRLYDEDSEELGHGGPPFLGPVGTLIKSQGDVAIYAYLGGASMGDSYLGETPLYIRGIKKIRIGNSFYFYVTTDRLMLDGDDPLLVAYLQKYSSPSSETPGQAAVKFSEAEKNLKTGMFADLTKLNTAQKEALAFVESTLGAVNSNY